MGCLPRLPYIYAILNEKQFFFNLKSYFFAIQIVWVFELKNKILISESEYQFHCCSYSYQVMTHIHEQQYLFLAVKNIWTSYADMKRVLTFLI